MTRSSDRKASQCHTLNFFYDDEDGCALTVYHNGVRFHIIADANRLKSETTKGAAIQHQYQKLLSTVQHATDEDVTPEKFKCKEESDAAEMHASSDGADDSQDSGHGTSDDEKEAEEVPRDNDSAVDVSEDTNSIKESEVQDNGITLGEQYAPESESNLQNWMLSPFGPIFEELAPSSETPQQPTLQEWYDGPAYYFNLEIKEDQLSAAREEESAELKKRMRELVPCMPIPKYIKDLNIPMIAAKDIVVIGEGTDPEPYHPTRVKVDDDVHFLKMVDMSQFQPTKREIKILKEIDGKGLHSQIRVPKINGLVYETSRSEIMGFLQTDIEQPTPLTQMLDSDVIEDNRKKWAKETEGVVSVLHEHNIVWGDAKADNFVVDKHGDLWIIDFGGSYTEGWVEPDLAETKEGDDMGTEKIVNALEDPEANTYEPEDGKDGQMKTGAVQSSRKRSRSDENDDEDEEQTGPTKRRK